MIGFLSTFIGISVGGGIAAVINSFKRSIGTIYAVCAGLILGLLSLEIVPEAIQLGNWFVFAGGFLAGVVLFELNHNWLHKYTIIHRDSYKNQRVRTGLFLALIISIHNLPMGVVLGTSEYPEFSFALLQAMILHNIPEGMILFTPLLLAGVRFHALFLLSIIIALPVAIGAFIGDLIGMQSTLVWAFLISLTVGTIYMVAVKEILYESIKQSSNAYSLLVACIGFGLMGIYLLVV